VQVTAARETAPGEPLDLEKVFIEHQGRVYRAAHRITGDAQDAEDVLQTVFLRLAHRAEGTPLIANLPSYLYRAAINAALDLLRARRERGSVAIEEAEGSPDASSNRPDRAHEVGEIRAWLRHALSQLKPRAAEVFALRHLEGYDNRDIARMLGISRVSVAVMLHRTRRRLRREFRAMRRSSR